MVFLKTKPPGDSDPSVYGYVGPDNYELYHDLHGPHVCGVYCVSRGDVGVAPYWSGYEEGDVYEGDVDLPWTGSDEPVNIVVSTSGSGGTGGPCDEESNISEGDVAMHQTGSGETVISVVSSISPGGPGDVTGSVADAPRDVIVMLSECRDSDGGTLGKIRMWLGSTPGRSRVCVVNHPTVLCLTRGCLPLNCALRG